ncbi:uncharacterized protein LOC119684553 [Teleopsis dalmanni]|uniref:uncharacterized protein LOC119684553 n=1 Tax=Teleopsis dalmanni TaxID=139649 RepID=UPI0018CE17BD|nr:uncharacterized protein LOC119684553 [Teleopsis dalmanni]
MDFHTANRLLRYPHTFQHNLPLAQGIVGLRDEGNFLRILGSDLRGPQGVREYSTRINRDRPASTGTIVARPTSQVVPYNADDEASRFRRLVFISFLFLIFRVMVCELRKMGIVD